ncbi:hypothetical protein [Caballeronia sp. GAWG1-5s-s]|uniref:hypothetical protein n=1 Tax=Caballeronia sp. GAWG1-5s-s TaxID=2921743 RepID=UPI002027DFE5|nr:hypothetical protein [Caballeronia sp. GAWG1-5s-s]
MMERALDDNALLHIARLERVDQIYSGILRFGLMTFLTGVGIGCFWYLLVALRAGVLA